MNPHRVLDCRGQSCPEPLFRTRYTLDKMKNGEILKILVDDPASEGDIRTMIKKRGFTLIKFEWDNRKVIFWIEK